MGITQADEQLEWTKHGWSAFPGRRDEGVIITHTGSEFYRHLPGLTVIHSGRTDRPNTFTDPQWWPVSRV